MAKPGPRPRATAPKSIHIAFTDDEKQILNGMGSGDVKSKIRALLMIEAERQRPKSKREMEERWKAARDEAKRKVAACNALREKMKEFGITDEELEKLDEEDDQDG